MKHFYNYVLCVFDSVWCAVKTSGCLSYCYTSHLWQPDLCAANYFKIKLKNTKLGDLGTSFTASKWARTQMLSFYKKLFKPIPPPPKHDAFNSLVKNIFPLIGMLPNSKHWLLLKKTRTEEPIKSIRTGNVCPRSHLHPLWSINFLMIRLVHPKPHCSSGRG